MKKKNGLKKEIKKDIIFTYPLIILLVLLAIDLVLVFYRFKAPLSQAITALITDPQAVQNYISSFGGWAPAIFILMQIIQVIIPPIPAQVIVMAGGMMFGTWQGTALSIFGIFIGTLIAFKLSQKFGRTLVEKFAGKHDFNFFDDFFEQKGPYAVFLLRLIPIMSFDVVSYGMGLTKIKFRDFALATLFGMIPGTIMYSYIGNRYALNPILIMLSSLLVIVLLLALPALKSYLLAKKRMSAPKKKE